MIYSWRFPSLILFQRDRLPPPHYVMSWQKPHSTPEGHPATPDHSCEKARRKWGRYSMRRWDDALLGFSAPARRRQTIIWPIVDSRRALVSPLPWFEVASDVLSPSNFELYVLWVFYLLLVVIKVVSLPFIIWFYSKLCLFMELNVITTSLCATPCSSKPQLSRCVSPPRRPEFKSPVDTKNLLHYSPWPLPNFVVEMT